MQARLEFLLLLLPYFCVAVSSSEASINSSLEAGPSTRSLHGSFLSLSSGNGSLKRSRNPTNEGEQTIHQTFDKYKLATPMRDRNFRLDQERRGSNRSKPIIIDDGDTETSITEPINHLVNREEECTNSAPNTKLTLSIGTPQINPVGLTADIPHKPRPPQVQPNHSKEFDEKFASPRHDVAALLDDHSGYPRNSKFGRGAIDTTGGSQTRNHLISQDKPSTSRGKGILSERYSFQILDRIPPLHVPKAAIATQHMAEEFILALPGGLSRARIIEMNTSHRILVPFVYKLMMKPLTIDHWTRILAVWRNMWAYSELLNQIGDNLSQYRILTRFLWISDFILESTIPQLFETSGWGKFCLRSFTPSPATSIINFLSEGKKFDKLNSEEIDILMFLGKIINQESDAIGFHLVAQLGYTKSMYAPILEQLDKKGLLIQTIALTGLDKSHISNLKSSSYSSWESIATCPSGLKDKIRSIFDYYNFDQMQFGLKLATNPSLYNKISMLDCDKALSYTHHQWLNDQVPFPQRIKNFFAEKLSL